MRLSVPVDQRVGLPVSQMQFEEALRLLPPGLAEGLSGAVAEAARHTLGGDVLDLPEHGPDLFGELEAREEAAQEETERADENEIHADRLHHALDGARDDLMEQVEALRAADGAGAFAGVVARLAEIVANMGRAL